MFTKNLDYRNMFSLATRFGLDSGLNERSPENKRQNDSVQDEGYNSPDPEEDIWDQIWTVGGGHRMSWESLGQRSSPREKPFLTEAGPDAVHHVWRSGGATFLTLF